MGLLVLSAHVVAETGYCIAGSIIIIIIIHNLYSAALLKDPAALYNNDNINIKSVR